MAQFYSIVLKFSVFFIFLNITYANEISHKQFEANFAISPYKEFFQIAPYAGYLFRKNHSSSEYIAMPQCQTALMEPGEALINKVCSRIIFENHWESDLTIAFRCFTRNPEDIVQYPFIYVLQTHPIVNIKYEVNGSAAFIFFKAIPTKGECTVVFTKDHPSGLKVFESYSMAKPSLSDEYCKNCREDLKPKKRINTFSDVQYTDQTDSLTDEVNREHFNELFTSILDPYLRLTSFIAVYHLNQNNELIPHCSAFLLNKGIAFVNIFECQMKDKAQHYIIVHRCFHGDDPADFHLKRSKIDSLASRDDGSEIYFQQHWSAQCRPTWEKTRGEEETFKLSPKGEL